MTVPVDERADFHQLRFLTEQKPVRIGDVENVQLREANHARPLPVMKTERVVPQLEILEVGVDKYGAARQFVGDSSYLNKKVV